MLSLIPVSWLLPAIAIAAPFVAYGYGVTKTRWEVRAEERAACNLRIASIEKKMNDEANARIEDALAAAREASATPDTPADLVRLCQQSAACRDRQK